MKETRPTPPVNGGESEKKSPVNGGKSDARKKLFSEKPAGRPLIFGHRGSPQCAAENTPASFAAAFEQGADGVELDVRLTRDDVPVIYHDAALKCGDLLRELSMKELRSSRCAECVWTLAAVLEQLAGRGYLDIELKEAESPEFVVPLARAALPADTYVYSSFQPGAVARCRELAPEVPAILIVESLRDPGAAFAIAERIDASGIAPWHEFITPLVAEYFHERALPLFTFTVNDPAAARRLAEWGLVGIISDVPGEVRQAFG
ncbi:glycerophosphodiester phosphodiesterase [candidate division KSB1 bacterium]|nr:glycerophosphodiester phosphodiesterase [candidate division KSB1 bacterium]